MFSSVPNLVPFPSQLQSETTGRSAARLELRRHLIVLERRAENELVPQERVAWESQIEAVPGLLSQLTD